MIERMSVHEVAAAHVVLAEHEESAPNHYFNPARPWQHLCKYVSAAPAQFRAESIEGRQILEFGAGTRNACSLAALLLANGASRVVCYEPGRVQIRQTRLAYDELLAEVLKAPGRFTLAGGDPEWVSSRALDLLRGELPSIVASPEEVIGRSREYDMVISNHVLEHVEDLDRELQFVSEITVQSAVQVHRVDFRDHRIFSDPRGGHSMLEFYRDGNLTTCNGLRASDVEAAFDRAGWEAVRTAEERVAPDVVPQVGCALFAKYGEDDLAVATADWVATRGEGSV